MFRFFTFLLGVCSCLFSCKSNTPPFTLEKNVLQIQVDGGKYSIAALSDAVIKVTFEDSLTYADRLYAPILSEAQPMLINYSDTKITAKTEKVTIEIALKPFQIQFRDQEGKVKLAEEQGYMRKVDTTMLRFRLQDGEAIYGTGERAIAMNRRGQQFQSNNMPRYGYGLGELNLNYCIPHIMSSENYMLMIDNPARAQWDIGHTEKDIMEFKSMGGNMAYYFIEGDSFEGLMKDYTSLTGRQGMLPIWAFGHFQSRFGYQNEQEARNMLQKTLDAGYPVDALILDIFWFGEEIEDGKMGELSWDTKNWPNPKQMISDFEAKGVKTITVSEPFFTRKSKYYAYLDHEKLLALDSDSNTFDIEDFYFGVGGLLDVFNPEAKDWMWDRYLEQRGYGVAGWWVDLAEPEKHPSGMHHINGTSNEIHGAYGHEWAKMLYEKTAEDFPQERLFHLGRAGFAGTQRYGLLPWTGDVARSWEGLAPQVSMMLSMGLSGLGYLHSDAGGFSKASGPDAELYIRWMQFATFTPIFRPHADNSVPAEPALWPQRVQALVKPYVELRYKMLPYNYTLAWENNQTGMPLARPLFALYPKAPDSIMNQYMWGNDLMVAAVLEKGKRQMEVYLPQGDWYNFWTGERLSGGKDIVMPLNWKNIPVFAKAGSLIPMIDLIPNTSAYTSEKLNISYYFDSQASDCQIYFDDGKTKGAFEAGAYQLMKLAVSHADSTSTISCQVTGNGYAGAPESRSGSFAVYGLEEAPTSINGGDITFEWDARAKLLRFEAQLKDGAEVRIQ